MRQILKQKCSSVFFLSPSALWCFSCYSMCSEFCLCLVLLTARLLNENIIRMFSSLSWLFLVIQINVKVESLNVWLRSLRVILFLYPFLCRSRQKFKYHISRILYWTESYSQSELTLLSSSSSDNMQPG